MAKEDGGYQDDQDQQDMEFLGLVAVGESQCKIDGQNESEKLVLLLAFAQKLPCGLFTSPDTKQLRILDRMCLFLIFGAQVRFLARLVFRVFALLLCLPS